MAEKMQESRTSDGAVKITQKERYQLVIENVSLKGLMLDPTHSSNLLKSKTNCFKSSALHHDEARQLKLRCDLWSGGVTS